MSNLLLGLGGQLGPDAGPVAGTQITAAYFAAGGPLYRCAMLDRNRSAARAPLIDECRGHSDLARQRCSTGGVFPVEIAIQVHGPNYSVATAQTQAMLQNNLNSIAI
ncbi:hypothetical protein ASC24_15970 [Bordetella pertussis]|nr:hypothetical protein ASC24_15970 [Bordetella pertussis]